ncbi:MAG: carboxypeptidase regulatory-like domain-containing protein [Acidobacteriota bacterium]
MRIRIAVSVLVALLTVVTTGAATAQERFGGLGGVITDTSQAPVPGVTVTATNKQTGATRVVVSGTDGAYRLPDLEPGRYTVTIELQGFQKVQAEDVLVLLGRTADVGAALKVGGLSEVVNVSADSEKQIDLRSTTVAHNVTAEEFDRMPKTRSFQGIALTSPGVNQGDLEGGFQVNGASGAENSFTVDGVNTNSLLYGSSRQDTVFEYLQEVQVKTGGIAAEYGGALGGVISAVTKSGGNRFTGEAHYYYSGSAISAKPVQRLQLSPIDDTTVLNIQDDSQTNNRNEVGGSLGGPILRDRLFFFGSVSPRFVRRSSDYLFSNGTEPGSIPQTQTVNQTFGKVTYSSRRVQASGSVLWTPLRSKGTLSAYDGTGPQFISSSLAGNAAQINRGYKQDQTNLSGSVNLTLSGVSSLSLRGGVFSDQYADTGVSNTTAVIWNTPSFGVAGVPAELQLPKGAQNTPRVLITNQDQTQTGFFQADYTHAFSLAGAHLLKGGAGVRHTTNDVDSTYPGGYVLLDWGRSFVNNSGETGTGTYGYYEVNDRGTRGSVNANMPSLYVQDTWTLGNRVTLNLGVRTERETIPSFRTDVKATAFEFGFGKKIAPRLGATFDVLGDGRLKAFGSWGRYYDWVKYELARGSFGGDTWLVNYRALDTLDVNSLSLANMPGRDLWGGPRDRRVPNFNTIDPDLKPMSQDATNLGLEYQLNSTTAIGVNFVHNKLTRAIEDVGSLDASGNEVYFAANPGEGVATTMFVTGLTPPFNTPKPLRQYDAVDFTISRRFAHNWFGSANVTISRLYGNYAGLANSDEISTPTTGTSSGTAQQQAGSISRPGTAAGRAWDLDELEWDSHGNLDTLGRLATDRPVVAKFYGSYTLPFGTQIGGFVYAGSGTPMSTVVNSTNTIPVLVNGRGDMGRTPFLSRTDLLVSHELRVAGGQRVRLEVNVINLFNQKTATHIFNSLNKGAGLARADSAIDLSNTDLSHGYDYNALILASPSGANAFDPRYGKPDLWQAGTQGQFSIKYLF